MKLRTEYPADAWTTVLGRAVRLFESRAHPKRKPGEIAAIVVQGDVVEIGTGENLVGAAG